MASGNRRAPRPRTWVSREGGRGRHSSKSETRSMKPTVTRLFLVRHGATTASAEDRFAGAIDTPLSEEGRRQATLLGDRLAKEQIDAVYASPMSRAMETARLACRDPI